MMKEWQWYTTILFTESIVNSEDFCHLYQEMDVSAVQEYIIGS